MQVQIGESGLGSKSACVSGVCGGDGRGGLLGCGGEKLNSPITHIKLDPY